MKFAVSCGGTGGHMFPGLAVASELLRRGHRVAVVLSGRAVENERSAADLPAGAEALSVPSRPVSLRRPASAVAMAASFVAARRALRAFGPDALLAMGSYTSLAPVLAARTLRIPVVLHEANAIPGSAIAHLARVARTVCVSFTGMERFFPRRVRIVDTGLPLRATFAKGIGGSKTSPGKFSVLIMGGSQGARDLNRGVVQAFAEIEGPKPDKIVHLAGSLNEADVRAMWDASGLRSAGTEIEVVGFEHDMARRYAEADICISRAGASSCFELALAGLPSILVPLPKFGRNHQSRNAEAMVSRNAALVFPQANLLDPASRKRFAATIESLRENAEGPFPSRAALRSAALAAARPDAASRVADEVERVVKKT